jgi:hypothetical protein
MASVYRHYLEWVLAAGRDRGRRSD